MAPRSTIKKLRRVLIFAYLLAICIAYSGYNTFPAFWSEENESIPVESETPISQDKQVVANLKRLPLHFEPNVGQFDNNIAFVARGVGYGLSFSQQSATLKLAPSTGVPKTSPENHSPDAPTLKLFFEGANKVEPVGQSPLEARFNYLIGKDPERWRTQVSTFKSIRYPGLYKGIDLIFYGKEKQPEYDFVVAPEADPKTIRLRIEGSDKLSVDDAGNLIIKTPQGSVIQKAPQIYQIIKDKKEICRGGYILEGSHHVRIDVGPYNPAYALVIDPVILVQNYASYLGGSGADIGFGIALDSSSNAYITGRTSSTNFPTSGALQGTLGGGSGSDAFISKLNPAGSALIYSTFFGGTGFDESLAITVDSTGQAHITGRTTSTDLPTQSPLQSNLGGGSGADAFVAKLAANGASLIFSTYLGGSDADQGQSIALDTSGNVYVTGETASTNFPTQSAFQNALGGGSGNDAFLSKYNATGQAFAYSTYLGGAAADIGKGVAVDSSGNAYVTGSTQSTDFPTQSAFQNAIGDGTGTASDAFISKFNSAGSALTFSSYLGGTGEDVGNAVTVDSGNRAYVAGRTASTDFPTQIPVQDALSGGSGTDAFISRVLANGSALEYSTYLGGNNFDEGLAVTVDIGQNAIIAGRTDSTDFPALNALQANLAGGAGTDGFATRYNSFGTLLSWSTYIGGTGSEQVTGVVIDANLNAYLTGFTGSTDLPTLDPFQNISGGGGLDAFISKIELLEINPALASNTSVMSPYYQVSAGVYSFIAITHPSLAGMNSQIGVRAVAFINSGDQFAPSTEFTVNAGETARLFFVQPNHPAINPANIPTANFIIGTEATGRVRLSPVASEPTQLLPGPGGGYPDVTMLSFWGAVVVEDFLSGFAVTFIGDLQSSLSHPGQTANRTASGVN